MVDSTDHISGKTSLTVTVTLSKNGGSFVSPSGTVSEVGNGYYKVAGNATDTNTLGPLILHATASGADPTDIEYAVVAFDPQSATNLGLTNLDTTVSSRSSLTAAQVNSEVDTALSDVGLTTTVTGRIDAAISTRLASASYTVPPTAGENADAVWDEVMSGHTVNGSYGERIVRARTTQAEVSITGSYHVAADVHEFQSAVIDNAAFAADALAATNFAASVGQEFADALLGRNIAGGSDGGRMVKDALRFLRNRFAVSSGTLTVYQEDDTTTAWTASVTGDAAADPIVESNPA
jgi:hypothetical protein